MREHTRSRWARCGRCAALLFLLGGCEQEAGSTLADASPADVAGDLTVPVDARPDTSVDVRDDAPAPPLDARPPAPDASPDVAPLDAAADRAPPDAPAGDVVDKFGDVAEAVDDASAPEGAIVGTVSFSQAPGLAPGGFISTMLASFARRPAGAAAAPACTTSAMGPCSVKRCLISYADAGTAPPSVSFVGAGEVEVDGIPGARVALPRLPTLGSYLANRFEAIFRGGETLRVRASGDPAGMPAFVATVPAPTPVTLTAPTLPAGSIYLPVSVAQAMQLRWTGGGAERVDVTVLGDSVPALPPSTMDHTQVTVECHFPAAPGAATIPLEVMSQLRGSVSGTVTVGTYQTRAYRVAPHVVTVFAGATAAQWAATFP